MTTSSELDRRNTQRRRVLKGAYIVFNDKNSTLPCRVRNISGTGAQLEFETSFLLAIPDAFDLMIELDGMQVPCTVVRKHGTLVGVQFDGPITKTAPTRAQIVQPTLPHAPPSLRKKPVKP